MGNNKTKKEQLNDFFGIGNWKHIKGDLYEFKRVIDDENVIVVTNNITFIGDYAFLVVGENKGILLNPKNVWVVHNFKPIHINSFAVKVNKNDFSKVIIFEKEFDDFIYMNDTTFEELLLVSKEQEKTNTIWQLGYRE